MNSRQQEIATRLEENIQVQQDLTRSTLGKIEAMVDLILAAYRSGGKVIFCGNGGSAADAQHLAAELVGRFKLERRALPAIALNTNTSILTALGNDYGYETVFSRQVEALANKNDIVIGLSTSGNSPNIIKAIEAAKSRGAKTIGLSGGNGGKLAKVADLAVVVPSDNTPRIQEAHITIGHIVCELVERELAGAE
ncbi:MAG: D-sedoheptulose 7-phosphate isomerase [Dehalococcoidales bacterium]|nr:D-sedoheptulose 7-phosphate isomerase [Dehalococcoidales bacterium]